MNQEQKIRFEKVKKWITKNKSILIDFSGLGIMVWFVLQILPSLANLVTAISMLAIENINKGSSEEFKIIFIFGAFFFIFKLLEFVLNFLNDILRTIKMTPPKEKKAK